jgi:predicted metal-dependent hydrolase
VTGPVRVGLRRVRLGGEVREYELRRSSRRTLAITVAPGGDLVVTAPESASDAQVETVLRRRGEWIRRRTREIAALPPQPTPREWVSGETHRYLGRQYRLKVVRGEKAQVKLSGQFFRVTVPEPREPEQVRRAMERWYLEHARETFERRMEAVIRRTPRLGLSEAPPLIVRRLQKRWGSCSAEGRILMNVDAVRLPMPCIDYLLVHELCHLRQPHHGPGFWRLLDACMPDWERWRQRLQTVEM